MPKKRIQQLINKLIPDPDVIKRHKNLQFLGDKLHEPNLWHLNRRSIAMAFAVGLFCAWIPTPTQMAIAAAGAIYFSANLPLSVGLVWITNPITMPPLFYFAYKVGLWFMNQPASADDFEFSLSTMLPPKNIMPAIITTPNISDTGEAISFLYDIDLLTFR